MNCKKFVICRITIVISMNIQLILREWLYDNPHDILHEVMTIVIKFLQRQYLLVTLLFSRKAYVWEQ